MRAERDRGGVDLEAWLRSPARRLALVVALVVVVSLLATFQLRELFGAARVAVSWPTVLGTQLAEWSLWALAAIVGLRIAGLVLRRTGSLGLVVAAQIPLSVLAAWGMADVQGEVRELLFERRPPRERTEDVQPGDVQPGDVEPADGEPADVEPERAGDGERSDRDRPGRERFGRGDGRGRFAGFWLARGLLTYWGLLGLGAGVHGYLHGRQRERRAGELELRAARLESELATAQLESLRRQVHPHFLFNALHSVGGLVRAGDERGALRTLALLGDLLRATLERGGASELRLADELEIAERYLAIEALRFGERLRVEIDVPDDVRDTLVPSLLVLTLVENAVRHGIADRPEGGTVAVRARREGEHVAITIEDDGPGFPERVLRARDPGGAGERGAIGLANSRERLRVLHGDAASLSLENAHPARGTSTPARGTRTPARGTRTPARGTRTTGLGARVTVRVPLAGRAPGASDG